MAAGVCEPRWLVIQLVAGFPFSVTQQLVGGLTAELIRPSGLPHGSCKNVYHPLLYFFMMMQPKLNQYM